MRLRFVLFGLSLHVMVMAQQPYTLHEQVKDFEFGKVLNNPSGYHRFQSIQSDLVILDFFGTWCVPCIRALPHLSGLQQQFRDDIRIILISNEQPDRLEKFVNARQPFPFPVVADEGNTVTNLFAPPSYPYTVVINKEKKIVAITDATSITATMIKDWLDPNNPLPGKSQEIMKPVTSDKSPAVSGLSLSSSNRLVQLSQQLVYAAKTGETTDKWVRSLAEIPYASLKDQLSSDEEKKAFWINLYNGFTQVLLRKNPGSYQNRSSFFSSKKITVAGKAFSLDDIEHGILRRSKIKWSLGHLNKLFPGKTEKELRVTELDYRLHFALNCGAKSCPPIAFYTPENLHPQLELATNSYLRSETEYDPATRLLKLPAIMGWFRRDFGGKRKMIELLKDKKIIPPEAQPRIRFKSYDWTLYTSNYKN